MREGAPDFPKPSCPRGVPDDWFHQLKCRALAGDKDAGETLKRIERKQEEAASIEAIRDRNEAHSGWRNK
jgi:hypothetical protein